MCRKQDIKSEISGKATSLGASLLLVCAAWVFLIPMVICIVRMRVVGLSEAFKASCFLPITRARWGGQTVVARYGAAQQGWSPDTTDSYFPPDAHSRKNRELAITRLLSIHTAILASSALLYSTLKAVSGPGWR